MADADDTPQPEDAPQPDPRATLMQEVAEQMDQLDVAYPDGFAIGRIITIIEIEEPNGNSAIRLRSNMKPWVARGMLHTALRTIDAMEQAAEGE